MLIHCAYVLNDDMADIETLNGICSLTFFIYNFPGLSSDPSVFSIKDSRSA